MAVLTPSGEQIIILLNETFVPPTIFADTNLLFGTPTPAPDGATDYDTVVIATGIPGRGYYGTAEIHYTRCPLSNLEGQVVLYSTSVFTLQAICDQMNALFDTFLDPTDFDTPTIPTLSPGQMATVTLTAASASLGWEGSVDVTINYGKPYLSTAISSNRLSVLSDTMPTASGAPNLGSTIMFTQDWTSYRDALALKTYNPGFWYAYTGFTDYVTISNVLKQIGLPAVPQPAWFNTSIGDYPTSQVAGANTKFDRVVVLNSYVIRSAYWPGNMYFHYNLLDNR